MLIILLYLISVLISALLWYKSIKFEKIIDSVKYPTLEEHQYINTLPVAVTVSFIPLMNLIWGILNYLSNFAEYYQLKLDGKLNNRLEKHNFITLKGDKMDKNTHVYCTKCIRGKLLIKSIVKDKYSSIPDECEQCNPYDPEDSRKFEDRPFYVEDTKNIKIKIVNTIYGCECGRNFIIFNDCMERDSTITNETEILCPICGCEPISTMIREIDVQKFKDYKNI